MECLICERTFQFECSLVQHTEQVHGRACMYDDVRCWENSRSQVGEITMDVSDDAGAYFGDDVSVDVSDSDDACDDSSSFSESINDEVRYECAGCNRGFQCLGSLSQHLAATGHSERESRLIHVMVQDVQQSMLEDIESDSPSFFEAYLHFDGSARPNPGAGGAGVHLVDDRGRILYEGGFAVPTIDFFDDVTSNQAEYAALEHGLNQAVTEGIKRLCVRGDSLLVIRQLNGTYECRSERLLPYYYAIRSLERHFHDISYEHVPRHKNTVCDRLADEYRAWA